MTTSSYQLAPDVFACLPGESLVFLDLHRDQYFLLDRSKTAAVLTLFKDLGELDTTREQKRAAPDLENATRIVEALVAKGLLKPRDGTVAVWATPSQVQASRTMLVPQAYDHSATARAAHWVAFFRASLAASAKLHWYPIHQTVRTTRNRKQGPARSRQPGDDLANLVSVFHRLRPFYPRKYLCLYDSLSLLEYLSVFSHFPQWVFGVKTEPFSAHCWVQENNCVLNDTVERVREYTPIMTV